MMKKLIVALFISGIGVLPAFAQLKDAKEILEKTSEAFQKAGGIKATFEVSVLQKGASVGKTEGYIRAKGEKFVLNVEEAATWFDGKTQWTYLQNSNEVNISTPTEEELQEINPYAFLSVYRGAYNYKLGKTSTWKGKPVYEVILTSGLKQQIAQLTLYITRNSYEPIYMKARLTDGTENEIVVKEYKTKQTFADTVFAFDPKKYPNVEIIDLR